MRRPLLWRFLFLQLPVGAATIYKLNNATNLNSGGSWNGGVAPGSRGYSRNGPAYPTEREVRFHWRERRLAKGLGQITNGGRRRQRKDAPYMPGSTLTLGNIGNRHVGFGAESVFNMPCGAWTGPDMERRSGLTLAANAAISGGVCSIKSGSGTLYFKR